MSIRPTCDRCGLELADFGGILLSPPDNQGRVQKYHLCQQCYRMIEEELRKASLHD